MQKHIIPVTPAGATGSATGSTAVALFGAGKLHGMYLDFKSITSDTCVRIEALSPAIAVFSLVGSITDGWYFPREVVSSSTGASYTSTAALIQYPIIGSLVVRVGSSSASAAAVTAYVYVDEV